MYVYVYKQLNYILPEKAKKNLLEYWVHWQCDENYETRLYIMLLAMWLYRMLEEVDAVVQSNHFVQYEDLSKLKYCSQVLKETLRLYPPAPATARTNLEEVTVNGFRIPADSWMIVRYCHSTILCTHAYLFSWANRHQLNQ